jgi:hypothetical protein
MEKFLKSFLYWKIIYIDKLLVPKITFVEKLFRFRNCLYQKYYLYWNFASNIQKEEITKKWYLRSFHIYVQYLYTKVSIERLHKNYNQQP